MSEEPTILCSDAAKPCHGCSRSTFEALVLAHRPGSQGEIDPAENGHQRGWTEATVVANPSVQLWIDPLRELVEAHLRAVRQTPLPAHCCMEALRRLATYCRIERHEEFPDFRLGNPRLKREPEKVKALGCLRLGARTTAHDPSFLGMQLQSATPEAFLDPMSHSFRLDLGPAVHDDVVSIPFERHVDEAIMHPSIEREMQEDIRKHRADDASLRRTPKTRLCTTIGTLNACFQPALDVEQHPSFVGEAPNRS